LGNHCNYNCAYCPDVLKSGSIPLPDPKEFAKAFGLIHSTFDNFNLQIMGGEPTTYEGLDLALSSVRKDSRKQLTLETNGSKPLSWWQENLEHFANVIISVHKPTDIAHILKVSDLLQSNSIELKIKFPIQPINWNEIVQIRDSFRHSGFTTELHLLYKNFTRGNNEYYDYSQEQMDYYYRDKGVESNQISNQIEQIRIHKLNEYTGHMCWAGVEQFVIDRQGYVFRGWCEQNGTLGNILEGAVNWATNPVVCRRKLCTNGFDLQSRKSENSWGNI
jgi:sulfatase maturation enzyme AslB (radical SAM superfamily)